MLLTILPTGMVVLVQDSVLSHQCFAHIFLTVLHCAAGVDVGADV